MVARILRVGTGTLKVKVGNNAGQQDGIKQDGRKEVPYVNFVLIGLVSLEVDENPKDRGVPKEEIPKEERPKDVSQKRRLEEDKT